MLRIHHCVLLAFATLVFASSAENAARVTRMHYEIVASGDKAPLYGITVIGEVRPVRSDFTYLVLDHLSKHRYVLTTTSNHQTQTETFEIREVTDARKTQMIRSTIRLPLQPGDQASTRAQLSELTRRKDLRQVEAAIPVTIEAHGQRAYSETARADEWENPLTSAARREKMRGALDPEFAANLGRLQRDVFHLPHFKTFCINLARHVADVSCAPSSNVAVARTANTCEDDAAFGYPCRREATADHR